MKYFNTLPKVISTDTSGISRVFTNLMARASILPSVLKSPLVYYKYDVQENDTPEIVANKYYGDSYRYWIVLFANEALDPQWSWPMNSKVFQSYMDAKYPDISPQSEIHHYEKILTQYDYGTNTTTVNKVQIDVDTYNSLVEQTKILDLPTGIVRYEISKTAVSVYQYEYDLNESKRNISILNSAYVDQFETEFKKLMNYYG